MDNSNGATATPARKGGPGAWTESEHSLFEEGVIAHGWGSWKIMEGCIPTRDRLQIKSHAQKYRKHHAADYARLQVEHTNYISENGAGEVVKGGDKVKNKKATPRRRGSIGKAKTSAARPSPRRRRSTPSIVLTPGGAIKRRGSVKFNPANPVKSLPESDLKTPQKKTAKTQAESSPLDIMVPEAATSSFRRVSLGPASSTISAWCPDLMSPSRCSHRPFTPAQNDPQESQDNDELAALAAAVTPSPDPNSAYLNLLNEASTNELVGALPLLKLDDDEFIDPLLQLEVDDNNLDMIAEFLDPSWKMVGDEISMTPFSAAPGGDESIPGSEKDLSLEIPSNSFPDLRLFVDIRAQLVSPPDFNNPQEYALGQDGMSRLGIEKGALCRARIKTLLDEHLDMGWWKEGVLGNIHHADPTGRGIQSANGTLSQGALARNDNLSFKKFALEQLIALTAAMHDVDHWHTPTAILTDITTDANANTHAMEVQRFNDQDDIRHVGQLVSGLWERVNRSLSRYDFVSLGNDDSTGMNRSAAINKMVGTLDLISRQESHHE